MMQHALLEKSAPTLNILKTLNSIPFPQFVEDFCWLQELELGVDVGNPLSCLQQLSSPLQKLEISVQSNINDLPVWAVDEFLQNIQHLPLEEIQINYKYFVGEYNPIPLGLQLPSVKLLRIHPMDFEMDMDGSDPTRFSFNTILCFPNLKKIELYFCNPEDLVLPHPLGIQEEIVIREQIQSGEMYRSDIWERIPTLSKVECGYFQEEGIQTSSFSRKDYDQWLIEEEANRE